MEGLNALAQNFRDYNEGMQEFKILNKEFNALETLALVNTGTMRDLFISADKAHSQTHGKFWAAIDSRLSYLETGVFAIARCAKHIALLMVSILGMPFAEGRQFFYENLCRSFTDVTGIFIGLVGVITTEAAMHLTAAHIRIFDRQLGAQAYITKKLNEACKVAVDQMTAEQARPHLPQRQIEQLAAQKREVKDLTQSSIEFVHKVADELGSYEIIKIYLAALTVADIVETVMDADFIKGRITHYTEAVPRLGLAGENVWRHMQQLFDGIGRDLNAERQIRVAGARQDRNPQEDFEGDFQGLWGERQYEPQYR